LTAGSDLLNKTLLSAASFTAVVIILFTSFGGRNICSFSRDVSRAFPLVAISLSTTCAFVRDVSFGSYPSIFESC